MKRLARFAVASSLVAVPALANSACSSFEDNGGGSADGADASNNTNADAAAQDGGTVGSPPVNHGIAIAVAGDGPHYVIQGSKATLTFSLERLSASSGPVDVRITGLPQGVTSTPVTVPANGTTGTIELSAAADTKQGAFDAVLDATEQGASGAKSTTKAKAFVRGAPGTLDTTYADKGVFGTLLPTPIPESGFMTAATLTNDDALLVEARIDNTIVLAKLTIDGALDTTFATGGKKTLLSTQGSAPSIDVFRDGPDKDKILSVIEPSLGSPAGGVVFTKLNADGSPSVNVGGTGQVRGPESWGTWPGKVVALPTGGAMVFSTPNGATTGNVYSYLARYDRDGKNDTTYASPSGASTVSPTSVGGTKSGGGFVSVDATGHAFVVFLVQPETVAFKGYLANGTTDSTIGTSPNFATVISTSFATGGVPLDLATLADGRMVLLSSNTSGALNWRVLSKTGLVEATHAVSAGVEGVLDGYGGPKISVQADGKLLIAGMTGDASHRIFAVARYNQDGSLDSSFGNTGIATVDSSIGGADVDDRPVAVNIQKDGRIVVTGTDNQAIKSAIFRLWQ